MAIARARGPRPKHPARVKGPVGEVTVRRIWRFEDLATSLQREAKRRTGGDLTRVTVLGKGKFEVSL